MDIEQVRAICMALPGVTEDMPFGDDIVTFRLEGKIFVCLWLGGEQEGKPGTEPRFAIKLAPETNEELRERYAGITPAWHWNKKHWSDIYYDQFQPEQVTEWIELAYQLIISKLPRRVRVQYQTTD